MSDSKVCRLCMNTDFLSDLYQLDGETSLHVKTSLCINLNIYPEDGLPSMICEHCKKMINEFYNFKQKCLKVDLELRTIKDQSISHDIDADIKDIDIQIMYEFNYVDNVNIADFKDTFDFHTAEVPDDTNLDINLKLNEIITAEEPQIHPEEFCVMPDTQNDSESSIETQNENDSSNSLLCELCGSTPRTKAEFKRHILSHDGVKSFQCNFCPKRFTRAETNAIHARSHFGIRPFICEKCGQSSAKRQDLIRHMKIHSDEKQHSCPCCGKRFKRSGDLYSHIRTHSGARPYKCQYCGKDYTSHGGLRKHYKMYCKKELYNIK